jgi:hypothetical protein
MNMGLTVESEYIPGLRVGQGVNVELGTTHGSSVEGTLTPSVAETGQEVEYALTVLTSSEAVAKAFSLNAEFSYSGLFTASASAKFVTESKVSRYRTYVMARCIVRQPVETIELPKLREEAKEVAKTSTRERFTEVYGTEFLAGVRKGGAYFGIIEIETMTGNEQQEVAAAVSASGCGGKASANISDRLQKVTENMQKRVFVIRSGGDTDTNPVTPEEIIKQALEFPSRVSKSPVVLSGIYQRYDRAFRLDYKGQGSFDADKRARDLQLLGRRYLKLMRLRNDFEYVLDHYNDYQLGAGVVFECSGTPAIGQPLSKLNVDNLPVASEGFAAEHAREGSPQGARQHTSSPGSATITQRALADELERVEEVLRKVKDAANRAQSGNEYESAIPAPYVASIGLPEIKERNMELEKLRKQVVPTGMVAMWSGPVDTIPEGWALCDGENGTLDLRDRFVRGAGGDGPEPLTLGEADQHSHSLTPWRLKGKTQKEGEHFHRFGEGWYHRQFAPGPYNSIDTHAKIEDCKNTSNAGAHEHSLDIEGPLVQTTTSTVENKPRWYALCYIQKLPVS